VLVKWQGCYPDLIQNTPLDFALDRESEVPLGTQLAWKLRTLISTGALPPGARLPGLREIAEAAGVNVNTVRTVFARLEEQGLLASEQGRGTFVAPTARPNAALTDAAEAAIAKAQQAGVEPRELAAALYASVPARGERQALYEEIERLEHELAQLEPLSPLDREASGPGPRILSVEELRKTRDELEERLRELRYERAEWRAESEAERDAASRSAHPARWRDAGVWTGGAPARVSWISG
jgi:GntR family transcriptional regulator